MSDRQAKILAAIIEQYAELAAPVGSVLLAKLFDVSPATIRAEMAKLEEMGYITQPHTSAGRIPTDRGYRLYVNSIVETGGTNHIENRHTKAIQSRVTTGGKADFAIKTAVDSLVELTRNLGLATIGDQLYLSGIGNLFAQPEFDDGEHVRDVARLLDNLEPWLKEAAPNEALNVFIGSENPIGRTSGMSLIISRFRSPYSDHSYIGVLGPTRQSYARVMSLVSQTGKMLEEVL
ncbi:MAG: transcriptional regulator [Candidatus Nomurabacteria bacterium]|jgi:heat-inducible transcriptional repressor|nr:transcriptional regulator [Candidatus Nomurabacteria bacterium]